MSSNWDKFRERIKNCIKHRCFSDTALRNANTIIDAAFNDFLSDQDNKCDYKKELDESDKRSDFVTEGRMRADESKRTAHDDSDTESAMSSNWDKFRERMKDIVQETIDNIKEYPDSRVKYFSFVNIDKAFDYYLNDQANNFDHEKTASYARKEAQDWRNKCIELVSERDRLNTKLRIAESSGIYWVRLSEDLTKRIEELENELGNE